jgi:hypothetical protein
MNNLKMTTMKTKTRTIIAICVLGIIGFTNINAISDNKREEVVTNKGEMLDIESTMTNDAFIYSAQSYAAVDFENEFESYASMENSSEFNTLSDDAVFYSAQAYAAEDFENESADYSTEPILPNETALTNEIGYSAKAYAAADFENEMNNK